MEITDFERDYPQFRANGQVCYWNQGTGRTEMVKFDYTFNRTVEFKNAIENWGYGEHSSGTTFLTGSTVHHRISNSG